MAVLALLGCSGGDGSVVGADPPPYDDDRDDGPADSAEDDGDAECGNGIVETGEECDSSEGCTDVCKIDRAAICGDGVCAESEIGACARDCDADPPEENAVPPRDCGGTPCECDDGARRVLCTGVPSECHYQSNPRYAGDCSACVPDGTGRWPECYAEVDCWQSCEGGHWVTDPWCSGACHREDVPDPVSMQCPCPDGPSDDNMCHLSPGTEDCPMTQPGGYCDPNGDRSYEDANWVRGWTEFGIHCG